MAKRKAWGAKCQRLIPRISQAHQKAERPRRQNRQGRLSRLENGHCGPIVSGSDDFQRRRRKRGDVPLELPVMVHNRRALMMPALFTRMSSARCP